VKPTAEIDTNVDNVALTYDKCRIHVAGID